MLFGASISDFQGRSAMHESTGNSRPVYSVYVVMRGKKEKLVSLTASEISYFKLVH